MNPEARPTYLLPDTAEEEASEPAMATDELLQERSTVEIGGCRAIVDASVGANTTMRIALPAVPR